MNQSAIRQLSLLALCALLIVVLFGWGAEAAEENVAVSEGRSRFQLPKLFDFQRFKQLFRKTYAYVEDVARNKIFLGRAFRVFLSGIAYKYRKRSHYLALNQMSDWTPSEINSMYINFGDDKTVADLHTVMPLASEPEILQTLDKMTQQQDEAKLSAAISEELHLIHRRKRQTNGPTGMRNIDLESKLIGDPTKKREPMERVESNNPQYEAPEVMSFGAEEAETNHLTPEEASKITGGSSSSYLNLLMQGMHGVWSYPAVQKWWTGEAEKPETVSPLNDFEIRGKPSYTWPPPPPPSDPKPEPAPLPDEVFVDLREIEPECYQSIKDQGQCGSCYIFATMAQYEWHFCHLKKKKASFSEQYVVDCGRSIGSLHGCEGGLFTQVSKFVQNYGLELGQNYPYRARQDQCPYSPAEVKLNSQKMGYIRMSDFGYMGVDLKHVEGYLKQGPMVVNMYAPEDFSDYGGGVDSAESCNEKNGHSVLLIGSGREDGEEYWLFRNSYSNAWGEKGHYKMSKQATECIETKSAYRLRAPYVIQDASQPGHQVSDQIKRHYMELPSNVKRRIRV